jgi:hypothetical protein
MAKLVQSSLSLHQPRLHMGQVATKQQKYETHILKPVLQRFSRHSKNNSTRKWLPRTKLRPMYNRFHTVPEILSRPYFAPIHFSSCHVFQDHNFKFSFSLVINPGRKLDTA